jgi:hypothetical protein
VLEDFGGGPPQAILIGTGSELSMRIVAAGSARSQRVLRGNQGETALLI